MPFWRNSKSLAEHPPVEFAGLNSRSYGFGRERFESCIAECYTALFSVLSLNLEIMDKYKYLFSRGKMMKSILFAVLTAVCWGIAPFFEKEGLKRADPFMVTLIRCSMLFLVSFFWLAWNKRLLGLMEMDLKSLTFIVLGGIFSAVIGQITYFYALKYGESWQVIPVVASYPLITVAFSLVFLGVKISFDQFLGMLLIIWGIFYLL